jgi:hypothetical protein
MVGSFLGVVAERVPAMVRRGGMQKSALSVRHTVRCASTRWRHGRISAGELAASARTMQPVQNRYPAANLFTELVSAVFLA